MRGGRINEKKKKRSWVKKGERKNQKEKGENWEAEMIDIHERELEKEGELQREREREWGRKKEGDGIWIKESETSERLKYRTRRLKEDKFMGRGAEIEWIKLVVNLKILTFLQKAERSVVPPGSYNEWRDLLGKEVTTHPGSRINNTSE